MIMIGTIVNAAAVIAGGGIGLLVKKAVKKDLQEAVMKALGIAVIFLGAAGALAEALAPKEGGGFETRGTLIMISSITLGTLLGELLKIENGMEKLGEKIKKLFRVKEGEGKGLFVQGFVTNALVVCVGAMAVVGALQDGINHDPSTLFAKSILDAMISMVFAASLGVGVLFASIPLFIYQGLITLLAGWAAPLFTDNIISVLSYVGNILIAAVGINLLFGKTLKVGNMLPALLFAAIGAIFF